MRLPLLAILAALPLLSGCSDSSSGGDGDHDHTDVAIEGNAFSPRTVTIHAGDAVRWTNHDAAEHTATALDNSWGTQNLGQHEDADIVFAKAGTYQYHCKIHPSMTGTVVVE
jgi:plastocyanin